MQKGTYFSEKTRSQTKQSRSQGFLLCFVHEKILWFSMFLTSINTLSTAWKSSSGILLGDEYLFVLSIFCNKNNGKTHCVLPVASTTVSIFYMPQKFPEKHRGKLWQKHFVFVCKNMSTYEKSWSQCFLLCIHMENTFVLIHVFDRKKHCEKTVLVQAAKYRLKHSEFFAHILSSVMNVQKTEKSVGKFLHMQIFCICHTCLFSRACVFPTII